MAIIHNTRDFATDHYGIPLGVTDSAMARAEISYAEIRHQLAEGGVRY